MRRTVDTLRHGWYGNLHLFPGVVDLVNDNPQQELTPIVSYDNDGNKIQRTKPIDCRGLVKKAVQMINRKFIPICNGLDGTIDNLVVDGTYEQTTDNMPIDMLLIDLSSSGNADEPIEVEVN